MKSFLAKLHPKLIKKAIGAGVSAGFAYWLKARTGGLSADELGQIAGTVASVGVFTYFVPKNEEPTP